MATPLPAQSDFQVITGPLGTGGEGSGISGNTIAGTYSDSNGVHGFTETGGSYTIIDAPSAGTPEFGTRGTYVEGIDEINVVGFYSVGESTEYEGFLDQGGTFSNISDPLGTSTLAMGISGDEIVGYYSNDSSALAYGFLYNGASYTTIIDPNGISTLLTGISGNLVTGYYATSNNGIANGFVFNLTTSTYTTINDPLGVSTAIFGISGNVLVGSYKASDGTFHGFIDNNGSFTTVDEPSGTGASVNGISGSEIVGEFSPNSNPDGYKGFIAAVPEPPVFLLLGIGLWAVLGGSRGFTARRSA